MKGRLVALAVCALAVCGAAYPATKAEGHDAHGRGLDLQAHLRRADNYTVQEIAALWERVRVSDEYLRKYERPREVYRRMLASEPGLKLGAQSNPPRTGRAGLIGRREGFLYDLDELFDQEHDYPRVPIVLDFIAWSRKHGFTHPRSLLSTDPNDPEMAYISPRRLTPFTHTDVSGDLHLLHEERLPGEPFDLAIVSQTLEHLYNPQRCLQNLYSKLEPGGMLFLSAPALNIQHMTPFHFQHFTPMGLAMNMVQAGFEILEVGQWGNLEYERYLLEKLSWPSHNTMATLAGRSWSSWLGFGRESRIKNDRLHPCQVWTLVRRPHPAASAPKSSLRRNPRHAARHAEGGI